MASLNENFKIKNGLTVNETISAGSCVEADSFVKHDGTSSQFLKADGSVDSTTYTTCLGDITNVSTGPYLTGGGASGSVTVGIDSACASKWDNAASGGVQSLSAGDGLLDNGTSTDPNIAVDSTVVRTSGDQTIADNKTFTSTVCVNEYIAHTGDSDTYLRFQDNCVSLVAGADGRLTADTAGVVINDSGVSNDFRVESNNLSAALFVDGDADAVGIGTSTPGELLDVVGGNVQVTDGEFIGDLRGAVEFHALAGEDLPAGAAVYISGISGTTTVVSLADADVADEYPAFGINREAVTSGQPAHIVQFGDLAGLDTTGWGVEGTELYISTTAGELVSAAPAGETAAIQKMAKVTRYHATAGSITIMGAGRTNAVPNLNNGNIFIGNGSNQPTTASLASCICATSDSRYIQGVSTGPYLTGGGSTGTVTVGIDSACASKWDTAAVGDISEVTTSTLLSGGGTSGSVNIGVDSGALAYLDQSSCPGLDCVGTLIDVCSDTGITITGTPSVQPTIGINTTCNTRWNGTATTVQSNSANWDQSSCPGLDCTGVVQTIGGGDGIDVTGTAATKSVAVDSTVVRTTGTQTVGGSKTFSDAVCITGGTTSTDAFCITNSDDTADAAPVFTMKRDSASPADGDYLGQIKFKGENSTGGEVVYAKVTGKTSDVTAGTEDGLIETAVQKGSTQTIVSRQTHDALKLINGTGLEVDGNILSAGSNLNTLFSNCQGTVTSVTGGDGIDSTGGNTPSLAVDSTVVRTSGNQTIAGVKCFSNDICMSQNLRHTGDSDTYIQFGTDSQKFVAGACVMICLDENGVDEVKVNPLNQLVDFRVKSLSSDNMLFVDATADAVGIGTDTPGELLDVAGNVNTTGQFLSGGTDIGQYFDQSGCAGLDCTGTVTSVTGGDGIDSTGGNTPSLAVDSTVVRTSGAQSIAGVKTFTDAICVAGNIRHDGDSDTYIQFGNDAQKFVAGGCTMLCLDENGQDHLVVNPLNETVDLRVKSLSANDTLFVSATADAVGIGTDTPVACLHVDDDGATGTGICVTGGGAGAPLAEFTRTVSGGTGTVKIMAPDSSPQISFCSTSNTYSIGTRGSCFQIADNAKLCANTRLTIDNTGQVGIGTETPGELLDVAGNVNTTGQFLSGGTDIGQYFDQSGCAGLNCVGDITAITLTGGISGASLTAGNACIGIDGTLVTTLNQSSCPGINCVGTTTASNTQTFTNKSGNISQWTNDSGYTTCTGVVQTIGGGDGIDVTGTAATKSVAVDATVVRTSGDQTIAGCKTFSDNMTITGNLSVTGDFTSIDTQVAVTSAMSVVNNGTGPALHVCQLGNNDVVNFEDAESGSALYIENGGNVGINDTNPNEKLDVNGNINVTGEYKIDDSTIINATCCFFGHYAGSQITDNFISSNVAWNGAYTTAKTLSGCPGLACVGDITGVTAGGYLTGGSTSGDATIGLDSACAVKWDNASAGSVSNVTASAPLASTGGTTPDISLDSACETSWDGAYTTAKALSSCPGLTCVGDITQICLTGGLSGASLTNGIACLGLDSATANSLNQSSCPGLDCVGTVTSVAGGDGIDVTGSSSASVAVDGTVVRTTGDQCVGGIKHFTGSQTRFTGVSATGTIIGGCIITAGFMESNAPADQVYSQGTVLAINSGGCVVESTQANDTMVFGVAAGDSVSPVVMGAEPICITGEICVGDYIVTSDKVGHGMKADNPTFGTVIGQAMESGCGDTFAIKAMIRKM